MANHPPVSLIKIGISILLLSNPTPSLVILTRHGFLNLKESITVIDSATSIRLTIKSERINQLQFDVLFSLKNLHYLDIRLL